MPPKRRARTKDPASFVHPAHEQQEAVAPGFTLDEAKERIAELEEQLRVMSLQLNQTKNNITLNQTLNATKNRSMSVTDSPRGKKTRRGSSSTLKRDQNAGCSCSGDCGTKRCGCVKKDKFCSEFCKCTDLCKNKEENYVSTNDEDEVDDDKENEEENVQVFKKDYKIKAVKNPVTPKERVLRHRRLKVVVDEDSSSQDSPVGPPQPKSLFDTPNSDLKNRSSNSESSPGSEETVINPMKPRHQLIRSPLSKNNSFNKSAQLDVTDKGRSPSPNVSSSNLVADVATKIEQLSPSSNPMQPKHKLARSPIAGASVAENTRSKSPNSTHNLNNTSVFHDDDVFLPIPTPDSSQTNSSPPPPPDIFKEEVDWDQHKAILVKCRKCKRGFFPHRIEVHEKSCKKI